MNTTTERTETETTFRLPQIPIANWQPASARKIAQAHNNELDKASDLHTKADELLAELAGWTDAPPDRREAAAKKEMIMGIRFQARCLQHAAIVALPARTTDIETHRRRIQAIRQHEHAQALKAAVDALLASGGMANPQLLETTAKAMSGPVEARRSVSEIQAARNQISLADLSHIESELRALITATLMD
jgi:hypothetical protein